MSLKVLVVDDDRTLLRFLGEYLERERYAVITSDRGSKALRAFYQEKPDLVILDVMMPGMDGWEVCARIREMADTPIIFLTAKTAETDKLRGFRLGVDDYITKPFSLPEMAARVSAVLARSHTTGLEKPKIIRVGSLAVDIRKRLATIDEKSIDLTPTEFRLLAALAKRSGEAISKSELIEEVWGSERREGGNALRRYISMLREKIEADARQPEHLVTVRGYGYRLEA
ncbi:MAG: response regulator transcription factor [Anaerolineales bacterium]